MLSIRVIFCFAMVLAVSGCGGEAIPQPVTADAVSLAITDTIGVEMGDSCYMFGYAADCIRTDSMIYVLDMPRAKLQKYLPDGTYAGFIGGRGDGPGELFMPQWLEMFPDGSFLIQDVTDLGLYMPDGTWEKHIFTHAGNWPRQHTVTGAASFAVRWHEFLYGDISVLRQFIASYDLEGERLAEFMSDSVIIPVPREENTDALNRCFFSHYMAGDLSGNLYVVQRHIPDYAVICCDPEGIPFDTLSLEIPQVPRTVEEIALFKRHIEEYLTGTGTSNVMEWVYEPDDFKPQIAGLWLGWQGNLWVLRGSTETPVFDVWKIPEGEHLYTAELDLEPGTDEFLTFYITPWCRDFLAVHEDPCMVQRVLLISPEQL
ncbi:MAG TPA: hypothetical protein PLM22_09155 [Candidatus Sabulitectum sp.]|nr:hypothetical protein [Candidatus Sabulitectum sp.]HPJ29087.1 hypothetical protein [Candidatus Sabulitectum sp.]